MALSYSIQTPLVLFGSKTAGNAITTVALPTVYQFGVQANSVSKVVPTEGMAKIELHGYYLAGVSETLNSVQIRVDGSPDGANFYQFLAESTTTGTSTESQREFTIVQSLKEGLLAYQTQTGNFHTGVTLTGGTSSATAVIESDSDAGTTGTLTLSNISGVFQNAETITDTSTGSAAVNGILQSVTTFTLPIDISVAFVRISAKETGVATNAGKIFLEATISGR